MNRSKIRHSKHEKNGVYVSPKLEILSGLNSSGSSVSLPLAVKSFSPKTFRSLEARAPLDFEPISYRKYPMKRHKTELVKLIKKN